MIEINPHAFDLVPLERRTAVIESFSNAPIQIKEVLNTYGYWLEDVGDSPWEFNKQTGKKEKGSFYIQNEFVIKIDERKDNNEYGITFRHEYGHYIDDVIGNYSENSEYNQAFKLDKNNFYKNKNLKEMLHDLSKNISAFKSEYVSDIISALTINDPEVMEFYKKNKISYSYHEWEKYMCPMREMKSETFANLFSIYTENNSDIISFTEKWFPNIACEFQVSMDKAVQSNFIEKEVVKI